MKRAIQKYDATLRALSLEELIAMAKLKQSFATAKGHPAQQICAAEYLRITVFIGKYLEILKANKVPIHYAQKSETNFQLLEHTLMLQKSKKIALLLDPNLHPEEQSALHETLYSPISIEQMIFFHKLSNSIEEAVKMRSQPHILPDTSAGPPLLTTFELEREDEGLQDMDSADENPRKTSEAKIVSEMTYLKKQSLF